MVNNFKNYFKIDGELDDLIRKQRARSRKLEEVLGINIILECDKAAEKALDITIKTASIYDAKTFVILASPPDGETWAYRCSRDGHAFIEICKGDKYIRVSYDTWVKAVVSDASESLFCIKRENLGNERKTRKRKR